MVQALLVEGEPVTDEEMWGLCPHCRQVKLVTRSDGSEPLEGEPIWVMVPHLVHGRQCIGEGELPEEIYEADDLGKVGGPLTIVYCH